MNAKLLLFGSSESPYIVYLPRFPMKYRILVNGIVEEPTPVT